MRNPKDTMVSYYHFARMITAVNYRGSFKEFFDMNMDNKGNVVTVAHFPQLQL